MSPATHDPHDDAGLAFVTRLDGPSPETQLVGDMLTRALPVLPAILAVGLIGWGVDGALSAAYAVAIVAANFVLAAVVLARTARISLGLMMGAALFGYIVRLGLVFAAVLVVKDQGWVDLVPLGLTLIVAHLGLLVWETRYVSASLAFPTLKPGTAARIRPAKKETAHR